MKPRNLLFLMSDEHNKRVLGCHGHPMIRTPNLDRLASRGVRFTDAYCNSPICVPSRASFQTGRYVHDIRFWDNCIAYDGSIPSWAHRLRDAGHRVDFIGKLHFRSADDDNGFQPGTHAAAYSGWHRRPDRNAARSAAAARGLAQACRGSRLRRPNYQGYDDRITAAAESWLRQRAEKPDKKPWMLSCRSSARTFP